MTSDHPELAQEQEFVDRAYQLLDKGLADAERSMAEFQAAAPLDRAGDPACAAHASRRPAAADSWSSAR